ncbi:MAG: hypothetical protein KJ709_00940 [Nanoarchaeota archaeon]|nr:hypothetical protein [Nanoarchaeota archaeon]
MPFDAKDIVSFAAGAVLTVLGLFPLLFKAGVGPKFFELKFFSLELFSFILAIGGLMLIVNSVHEILQANPVGKISMVIAIVLFTIGFFQVLSRFNIGPAFFELSFINHTIYYILFIIEGVFLMIASVAMEI